MSKYKTLYGKDEFKKNNNKQYNIYIVNDLVSEKSMVNIFDNFINNQKKNKSEIHYVGIDFEFNKISKTTRDVALMQINLENDSNIGNIFLLCPPKLVYANDKLIELITQTKFIKILHGSESLDIPYLFNQLLINENNINNFCKNFYDKKIICELNNILKKNNKKHNKCSIYDYLISKKIITEEKLKMLDDNEELMGPIYLININVSDMSESLISYSLYDVIYLPDLFIKITKHNKKKHLVISEVLTIVNKYKRNIETEFSDLEKIINSMNNYFFYINDTRYRLNDFLNIHIKELLEIKYVKYLYNINYIKIFIRIFLKYIIFYHIYTKKIIYTNGVKKFNFLNFDKYFIWLKKYHYVSSVIKHINNKVIVKIGKI